VRDASKASQVGVCFRQRPKEKKMMSLEDEEMLLRVQIAELSTMKPKRGVYEQKCGVYFKTDRADLVKRKKGS
jgi:hypothetical protein